MKQAIKMFCEIIFGAVTLTGLALYYITLKNKREKIDFQGKHVVITGGSSGIGFDLCIEAFKQGAHVSVIARNKVGVYFFDILMPNKFANENIRFQLQCKILF